MLKNEKSTNRIEHQNRKTEIFWHKNRKANQENVQNRKTENPYAPSYKEHANVVKTRQDDKMTRWQDHLFDSAQFYKTYRLNLH